MRHRFPISPLSGSAPDAADLRAARRRAQFQALHRKYEAAFEQIQATLLSLDGSRLYNLLEEYRLRYGRPARERAFLAYHHWRDGHRAASDETTACLFELLPRHISAEEKLLLIRRLREQLLQQLCQDAVTVTVARGSDLAAVLGRVMRLVRRVREIEMPADFLAVQGWLARADMQALNVLARETEHFIACRRLADLMVQLATLSHLRALASPQVAIRVQARFEIPTAAVAIRFLPCFWREASMADGADSDQDLLVRLQEMALLQERQEGSLTFVEYVMRTLTPQEQEKLRALAAAEGLRTEILLRELQVKTIAARGDIEATIATAERLKAQRHTGKITSEHATASGTTKIEIENRARPCYIATACYGDAHHPDVQALRRYRDETLLLSPLGRGLARLYDRLSPPLARRMDKTGWLAQTLRRLVLEPLARRLRAG
ncbi:MAG: hypothetical protein JO250_23880 [Armatimonadetes bacterium]|nr:hypothetical protein [Armatimonadota bacterium]